MDLYQLKQFMTLAETGNMTMAAQKLFISQPNISRSLKRLEEELGLSLFDRSKNKMLLNHDGEFVLEHVRKIFDEIDTIQNAKAVLYPDKTITFAGAGSIYFEIILPLLSPLFPEYTFDAQVLNNHEEVVTAFLSDKCDLCITPPQAFLDNNEIEIVFLFRERLCVSIPVSNPLSQRKSISLYELEGQDFIHSTHQESLHSNELLEKYGIHVNIVYTTDQPISGYRFYHSPALVFDSSVSQYYGNLVPGRKLVPLEEDDATYAVHVAYKKKHKCLFKPIVNTLKELLGQYSDES